jgi:pantoate--beta-alanine ligase
MCYKSRRFSKHNFIIACLFYIFIHEFLFIFVVIERATFSRRKGMRIIESLKEMTETARGWLAGGSVGFVLVKGELHEGHMQLIQEAQKACEISVVSLLGCCWPFATPEERTHYQHGIQTQLQILGRYQQLIVFIPRFEEIYPVRFQTLLMPSGSPIEQLSDSEKNYNRSFVTLTVKLFHLVRPDVVYFGQKDALQIAILRQVIRDLNIDVHLRMMPTARENDGLALSSRNRLLSEAEREAAVSIYAALQAGKFLIMQGERRSSMIGSAMLHILQRSSLILPEHAGVYAPDTFLPVVEATPGIILSIAVSIGSVRLLDTITWLENGQWRM